MSAPQLDYSRIQKYVEDNLQARRTRTRTGLFTAHLTIAITFGLLVFINLLVGLNNPGAAGPMMGTEPMPPGVILMLVLLGVAMLVGLALHTASFMANSQRGEQQLRENLTLKAVQLELARLGSSEMDFVDEHTEKRKRNPLESLVHLSDDGELIPHAEQKSSQMESNNT